MDAAFVVINMQQLRIVAAFKFKADAELDAHERELATGTKHIVWENDNDVQRK